MKARVKATGEIVEVTPKSYYTRKEGMYLKFTDKEGKSYLEDELDFYVESKDPDYWEKLLHHYAGIAMQAMISNSHNTDYHKDWSDGYGKWRKFDNKELAEMATYYATALVEKLKND